MEPKPFEPVAIVGMGGVFPECRDPRDYWRLLREGLSGIKDVPASHWSLQEYFAEDRKARDKTYGHRGGFLPPTVFNPLKFGLPPQTLEATDSAQLFALLAACMALDDAGIDFKASLATRKRLSTIVGVTGAQELVIPLGSRLGHPRWRAALERAGLPADQIESVIADIQGQYVEWQEASFPGLLGNVIAGRIANRLDLGGTNCVVDAACASSLSALHLACLELQSGVADIAISGGVDTFNDIFMYMCFSKTPALSPSGVARPFCDSSDGTTLGEAAALFVLKRLGDAVADGDRVYAVIKGIGTSSDGKGTAIYAPSAAGQAAALKRAYRVAGYGPESVGLVEAHGTGTKVGDQTELEGLELVFAEESSASARPEAPKAYIGSVKAQIGHTKAAAGAAGMMKAVLALHHKTLPPAVGIDRLNPRLASPQSPFAVSEVSLPWARPATHPRRASVSAFGFGGSNFHLALEEFRPEKPAVDWTAAPELLAVKAATREGLLGELKAYGDRLARGETLASVAADSRHRHAAASGAHRAALLLAEDELRVSPASQSARTALEGFTHWIASEASDAAGGPKTRLRTWQQAGFYAHLRSDAGTPLEGGGKAARLIGMFPGQGAQYPRMLADLFTAFPEALRLLDISNEIAQDLQGAAAPCATRPWSDCLLPPRYGSLYGRDEQDSARAGLRQTDKAQPALAVVECGLHQVLRRFGFRAEAYLGHSFGELPALHASGHLVAPSDLLKLAHLRGQAMQRAGEGGEPTSLLAVSLSVEAALGMVRESALDLQVANVNAPDQTVVGGRKSQIEAFVAWLGRHGVHGVPLNVSAAFHTAAVLPAGRAFAEGLSAVSWSEPHSPCYSGRTGRAYPREDGEASRLLSEQMTHPLLFQSMIEEAVRVHGRDVIFCELGPSKVLSGLIARIDPGLTAISYDTGAERPLHDLAAFLAKLSCLGAAIDLTQWRASRDAQWFRFDESGDKPSPGAVVITGANYRSPRPGAAPPAAVAASAVAASSKPQPPEPSLSSPPSVVSRAGNVLSAMPASVKPSSPAGAGADTKQAGQNSKFIAGENRVGKTVDPGWLEFVQEHVRIMQKLGEQTAKLHEQFLAGQMETQKHLFQVVERFGASRGVVDDVRGVPSPVLAASALVAASIPAATSTLAPAEPPLAVAMRPLAGRAGLEHRHASPPVAAQAPAISTAPVTGIAAAAGRASDQDIETVALDDAPWQAVATLGGDRRRLVITVIAEKTGYPASSLAPAMSLEDDLGIDSIKKVEIISDVFQRLEAAFMPQLPDEEATSLQREAAAARTIQQLQAVFARDAVQVQQNQQRRETRVDQPPRASTGKTGIADARSAGTVDVALHDLLPLVKEIVAEKTGYGVDMLDPGMRLEDDLGIDSIKRVEILSGIAERMGIDEQGVGISGLRQAATLRDLADGLRSAGPAPAAVSSAEKVEGPAGAMPKPAATADVLRQAMDLALAVTAEKTGYDLASLQPDMALEDDLGIDSIKRVEIMSEIAASAGLDADEKLFRPGNPPRTIKDLAEALAGADHGRSAIEAGDGDKGAVQSFASAPSLPANFLSPPVLPPMPAEQTDASGLGIERLVSVPLTDPQNILPLPYGSTVVFYGNRPEAGGLAAALEQGLKALGAKVLWRGPGEAVEVPRPGQWAGLVLWAGAAAAGGDGSALAEGNLELASTEENEHTGRWVEGCLAIMRQFIQPRSPSASGAQAEPGAPPAFPRFLIGISLLGGRFGLETADDGFDNGEAAGATESTWELSAVVSGFVKTAAREWPEVNCKVVDTCGTAAEPWSQKIVSEMMRSGVLEVGIDRDGRLWYPRLDKVSPAGSAIAGRLADRRASVGDGVLVVSGGGRGVTASVALGLASELGLRCAILGRTPLQQGLEAFSGCDDLNAVKKKIIEMSTEENIGPREIKDRADAAWRALEVARTLQGFAAAGVEARVFPCDISKGAEVDRALAEVRRQWGLPVVGVVHGAGVLQDKLLVEKTAEQFRTVYSPKVLGLKNLSSALKAEPLRFILLFSSSTARFGRIGQADYAAANEALNKWSHRVARQWRDCQVISLNWGPWAGGMVTPSLEKIFAGEGIGLIGLSEGAGVAAGIVAEALGNDGAGAQELVVVKRLAEQSSGEQNTRDVGPSPGSLPVQHSGGLSGFGEIVAEQRLDPSSPALLDHRLAGRPVLPAALMLELIARGALQKAERSGPAGTEPWTLRRVQDFRVLKGLTFEGGADAGSGEPAGLFVEAAGSERSGDEMTLALNLFSFEGSRGTGERGGLTKHGSAVVAVGCGSPGPQLALDLKEMPKGIQLIDPAKAYEHVLFHGPALRVLQKFGVSVGGFYGEINCEKRPVDWLTPAWDGDWRLAPAVTDGIFQLLILWSHNFGGTRCLPTETGQVNLHGAWRDQRQVAVWGRVHSFKHGMVRAECWVCDREGKVLWHLKDVKSISDRNLEQAFKAAPPLARGFEVGRPGALS